MIKRKRIIKIEGNNLLKVTPRIVPDNNRGTMKTLSLKFIKYSLFHFLLIKRIKFIIDPAKIVTLLKGIEISKL